MDPLAAYVTEAGYRDRLLDTRQLARILGGSDQRRYGLVNRALKSGDLVRLKRGLYTLSDQHRTNPLHPFRIAQALAPGSYVSF